MKGLGPQGGEGPGARGGGEGGGGWVKPQLCASIPGRSRLGLNSRQPFDMFFMRGFAGCGASPLHPSTRGLRAAGLHPFTPSPGGCRLRGFTPSPGICGLGPSPLHSRLRAGLHPFTRNEKLLAACVGGRGQHMCFA